MIKLYIIYVQYIALTYSWPVVAASRCEVVSNNGLAVHSLFLHVWLKNHDKSIR